MKRLFLLLLLMGAMLGLAAQAPARALAPPTDAENAMATAQMPDCMASMEKTASHKPCDCSRADCIAAMLGGAPAFTLADPAGDVPAATASSLHPLAGLAPPLNGRTVGPEPDPPNTLT